MRPSSIIFVAALVGIIPVSATAAAPETVPVDSFIAQHVGTAGQLQQQISLDPVVRRRLARHFHTSAPAVTRYIQENLVLKPLQTAHRYQVYCVSRTGREYIITQRLPAGTPVFVSRTTGQPVLKLACGNPMVAALPPVKTKVEAYHSPALAPVAKPVPIAAAPTLDSHGPVVVAMTDTPSVVVMPTTKVGGFIGSLPVIHGGGGGFPLGFLAAIPILATVAGSHGRGNNGAWPAAGTTGSNTLGSTGTNTGNTGVTPVPEPAAPATFAVASLLLGGLLTAAARRKAR